MEVSQPELNLDRLLNFVFNCTTPTVGIGLFQQRPTPMRICLTSGFKNWLLTTQASQIKVSHIFNEQMKQVTDFININ